MESLERLVIAFRDSDSTNGLIVKSILTQFTNVEEMRLSGIDLETAGMTGQGFQSLKILEMSQCFSTSDHLQTLLTNISSKIERIEFRSCEMKIEEDFTVRFPSLKHVELFPRAETEQVSRIIELADNLEV